MSADERPPIESLEIEANEIEPEGDGHKDADERPFPNQKRDASGTQGPSYEVGQAEKGKDVHPGGSTDRHDTLSHADSGNENER